jgi:PAS domain S-box-containing protein
MLTPLRFTEGVIYDGRSIILTIAGLFTGPFSAVIAGSVAAVYRAWLGGAGALAGVLVIAESVFFGSLFYMLRKRNEGWVSVRALLLLSLTVHVIMLLLQLLIPGGVGLRVISTIGPMIIVLYTLGFVLIARLFLEREIKRKTDRDLFLTEHAVDQASLEIYRLNNSDAVILEPNLQLCRSLGYDREELSGMSLAEIDPTFSMERWEEQKRSAEKGERRGFETLHRRKDGSTYPVEVVTDHVMFMGETYMYSFARDISEQKADREVLRRSLEEKEILLREIHHRVRNNFSVITSLVSLQSDAVNTSGDAVGALEKIRDRIHAMNNIHSLLYRSGDVSLIDMRSYLHDLVSSLFEAYRGDRDLRLKSSFDPLLLDMDRAIPIGLMVNEAVTNILKHAYPGETGGSVEVSLKRLSLGTFELVIRDSGKGISPGRNPEDPGTLGLRLIQVLASQAQAAVSIVSSGGTEVRIVLEDVPQWNI